MQISANAFVKGTDRWFTLSIAMHRTKSMAMQMGMRRAVLGGLVADVLPARKNLTVVYTPGLSSKRRCFKSESLAKMCERRGFGFVTYDPTHSPGESTGEVRDVTLGARIRDQG